MYKIKVKILNQKFICPSEGLTARVKKYMIIDSENAQGKGFFTNLVSNFIFTKVLAFTLAEVLIVIGIIGVIAQMTIPTLVKSTETTQRVVGLKKAYSTLSQAYTMAVNEKGTPDTWGLVASASPIGATNIINALAPQLMIEKNCGSRTDNCFPSIMYKFINNVDWFDANTSGTSAKIKLTNGDFIFALSYGDCTTYPRGNTVALQHACGEFYYDINGAKSPNQLGKDIFFFYLTQFGIIPVGSASETSHTFDLTCKNKTTGRGCTAWMIYNGNQDYLKPCSSGLSWDGTSTCN